MMFNEKEMLELCEKYGICVVEKEGYPLLGGIELSPDFSISELLDEAHSVNVEERTLYTNSIKMRVDFSSTVFKNVNKADIKSCSIKKDKMHALIVSTIDLDNENKNAA